MKYKLVTDYKYTLNKLLLEPRSAFSLIIENKKKILVFLNCSAWGCPWDLKGLIPYGILEGSAASLSTKIKVRISMWILLFSNSLIIHQVKTKKITSWKEVWIPGVY